MNRLRRQYTCPYCLKKHDIRNVHFRCEDPGCRLIPDEILGDFLGGDEAPLKRPAAQPVSGLRFSMPGGAACPACGRKARRRICPSCHCDLPAFVDESNELIFAVIGPKESGKTVFIGVLINEIEQRLSAAFDCCLTAHDDLTIKGYERFRQPIFEQRIMPPPTSPVAGIKRSSALEHPPLIYSLKFNSRSPLTQTRRISRSVNLLFYDTAGEDLQDQENMAQFNPYIYQASGLIFLSDPLQKPAVQADLPADIHMPKVRMQDATMINRVANLIRREKHLDSRRLIDIPVAVTFTKLDVIQPHIRKYQPGANILRHSQHCEKGYFDVADCRAVSGEMQSMLARWEGNTFQQQLEGNFLNYEYFGISSLGQNPSESGSLAHQVRPFRVEDPLLYLLQHYGLIHGE